ncbi:MAG: hypothetical protein HCA27_27655 [Dolichospermum sp. DET67]|nr:hypothetical protein [Dolichospermum sp. DET67]
MAISLQEKTFWFTDIPLFFRGASGNESDKAVFAHILVEYSKQVDFESIMVSKPKSFSQRVIFTEC